MQETSFGACVPSCGPILGNVMKAGEAKEEIQVKSSQTRAVLILAERKGAGHTGFKQTRHF